ncbi:hypothetical protein GGQ08_000348 [Salinibacter ruber]|uniref:hypothetical protein n=1 Tax=Salinibacter ruber TaxID=146919 RepID=UPI002167FF8A|nr:hypothetical protein [Salinibacter ruber]MCS3649053.1 hypothetical protein [Salinibacter ruber]MCS3652308.1 hypothetical protein [Salinibacter ruber]
MQRTSSMLVDALIERWQFSGASEQGNAAHGRAGRPARPPRPERSEDVLSECARRADVREPLETLAALGHVAATDDRAHAT